MLQSKAVSRRMCVIHHLIAYLITQHHTFNIKSTIFILRLQGHLCINNKSWEDCSPQLLGPPQYDPLLHNQSQQYLSQEHYQVDRREGSDAQTINSLVPPAKYILSIMEDQASNQSIKSKRKISKEGSIMQVFKVIYKIHLVPYTYHVHSG